MDNSPQSSIISRFKLSTVSQPKFLIVVIVIIIAAAAGGYWYWSKSRQAPSSPEAPTLGSEIFDKTQSPLEGQVPDSNPFKNQKNPLDSIYKNPFE
ncbi:hypothetical protein L0Y69_03260 [bacterium]|nr:hypothetical protein [bacterium]